MNRDLGYVLNYMNKYTKDRFMQDSEPMLNNKDIELVLKHIYELEQRIDKAIEVLKLCNSKCSKEVIDILKGEENE